MSGAFDSRRRGAENRALRRFDQQYPGQSAYRSLTARSGGFIPAVTNAYLVGSRLADEIVPNWGQWNAGMPASAGRQPEIPYAGAPQRSRRLGHEPVEALPRAWLCYHGMHQGGTS